jgi:hypothetical protein
MDFFSAKVKFGIEIWDIIVVSVVLFGFSLFVQNIS